MTNFIYDVALSFAGEDRDYVKQVADQLRTIGIRVFYDEYERANLWGKELIMYLEDVYANKSKYVIIFVSKSYLEKEWTNHELKSALNRAFKTKEEYILPVKLDNTKLPGLNESIGYLSAKNFAPLTICNIFLEKLGLKNISAVQSTLLLYKLTRPQLVEDLSGIGASLIGTRWNTKGNKIFITATSMALAALEAIAVSSPLNRLNDLAAIQYIIPSSISIATVYESDLPLNWKEVQNFSATQRIGDTWIKKNESCILSVPSAVVPFERNYLLNPNHERYKELKVNRIDKFYI